MSHRSSLIWGGVILAASAIAIVGAVLLFGGGSDSDSASGTEMDPAATAPGNFSPSQEFQDCLAEQGIEIPEPGAAPPTQSSGDQADALEACAEFLPEGMGTPPGGAPVLPGG